MIKKSLFNTLVYSVIFVVTLFVLWFFLFLSTLISNDAIFTNMEKSVFSYKQREAFEFTEQNNLNSVADHYADSIWLNVAWNMGEGNPLTTSLKTHYYDGEEMGENAGLYYTVIEGVSPNTDYTRYWHGTAMFIRLFHLFTDVEGIKTIGFVTFLMLTGLSIFILVKRKRCDLAVILLLSLSAVQIWNIRLSIEYQPSFIIAFLLIPLFLIFESRGDKWLTALSVIGGVSVAFFDFLTTETVTILLPLVLVVAVRAKEKRTEDTKQTIILLLKCLIGWAGAYVGAFLVKWIVLSVMTDANVFEIALSSVAERMGTEVDLLYEKPNSLISSIAANLSMIFGSATRVQVGRTAIGILIFAAILLSVWYLFRNEENKTCVALSMLGLGAIVFIRFLLLNNHSYIHCFFTYRSLVTTVFALIAAMWLNISLPQRKRRR